MWVQIASPIGQRKPLQQLDDKKRVDEDKCFVVSSYPIYETVLALTYLFLIIIIISIIKVVLVVT